MNGDQTNQDFINLFNEIIQQQSVILGPDIATIIARKVEGMQFTDEGKVVSFQGNPQHILETLINEYVGLSGLIVKKTIEPLLTKYPTVVSTVVQKGAPSSAPNAQPTPSPQPVTPSPDQQSGAGGNI